MNTTLDEKKFYDGRFTTSFDYDLNNPIYRIYLQHSIYRADWLSFSWIRPARRILDIGCGGGKKILKEKAQRVVGMDLSLESLKRAADLYDWVVVASADALPFKTNVFDCIYSAHLIGHIPPDRKRQVLENVWRVTAKGGENIHYVETDGDNFAVRFAKRSPDLYQKNFIEINGHFGLERPSAAIGRIKDFFRILQCKKFNSGIYSVEGTLILFEGYQDKNLILKCLWPIYRWINQFSLIRRFVNLLLGPIMRIYNQWTPFDEGDWILVRCVKD